MLYRHFPKIANKEISILSLSLPGTSDPDLAAALLRRAAELGINLLDAGNDPVATAALVEAASRPGAAAPRYRLYEFSGETASALAALLDRAAGRADDFVAIRIPDAARLAVLHESGVLDLAADARRNGRCGHIGFTCPPNGTLAMGICDSFDGWDFFRSDFSFLDAHMIPAIRYAATRSIGFIATDPLAHGYLENVPAAVHGLYYHAPVPRSHAEWALRGIWEMQETVSVVLVPKNADELFTGAILAEAGRPNSLTSRELEVLDAVRKLSGYSSANP